MTTSAIRRSAPPSAPTTDSSKHSEEAPSLWVLRDWQNAKGFALLNLFQSSVVGMSSKGAPCGSKEVKLKGSEPVPFPPRLIDRDPYRRPHGSWGVPRPSLGGIGDPLPARPFLGFTPLDNPLRLPFEWKRWGAAPFVCAVRPQEPYAHAPPWGCASAPPAHRRCEGRCPCIWTFDLLIRARTRG